MARMPNQINEPSGLLEQIARCRRLAKEVGDQITMEKLLALAAEYEQRLNSPQPK
jgi:hypothetical protein